MFKKHEYIYQVYKMGSITKAAESLFISQPSLSVAIKKIEEEIGTPLFERSGGSKVVLTDVGKEYIKATERIMNVEKDFLNRINDIFSLETGKITVGGTNYLSSYLLPQIINSFSKKFPKIEVTLVEANSLTLGEMIENEKLDIVIDSFDSTMSIYDGYPLKNEKILLCVPEEFPINKQLEKNRFYPKNIYKNDFESFAPVSIKHFKNEPFILLKNGNDMFHRAQLVFKKEGVEPKILFSVDQMNISYALATSGMGVCFLTDTLFKYGKHSDNVCLYNVSNEYNSRTLYVAHKKNKYITRAMEEFISIAKEVTK